MPSLSPRPIPLLAWTLVVLLAGARAAHADRTSRQETAAARELFQQGLSRFDAQDFGGAAEAFQRSYDLRPSPVVGYNLASALRELGRWVDAVEVLRAVTHAGDAPPAVVEASQAMLDELEPKLGRLVIHIDGPTESLELRIDDRPLSSAVLDTPMPTDPGTHHIVASRDGEAVGEATVDVAEGGQAETTITVPPLPERRVPTAREAAALGEDGRASALGDPQRDEDAHALRRNPWLWTGIGAVVVGGLVATILLTREPKPGDPVVGTFPPGVVRFP